MIVIMKAIVIVLKYVSEEIRQCLVHGITPDYISNLF